MKGKPLLPLLREVDNVLVTSHVNPDGDAIGSVLAATALLKAMRKQAFPVLQDGIPERFRFLPGAKAVKTTEEAKNAGYTFEATLLVDAGEIDRMGNVEELVPEGAPLLVIDHHVSTTHPGGGEIIDTRASATCELLAPLFEAMEVKMSPAAATALYTGILTDTGRFRFVNTTARALAVASRLVEAGADPAEITREIYFRENPLTTIGLGRFLSRMQLFEQGRIAISHIPFEEKDIDTEGYIDHLTSLDGVEIAALLRPLDTKSFKISFRSTGEANVERVARLFGGGGHEKAAGGTVEGGIDAVIKKVVKACRNEFAGL
ncbi:MAG: bifunctional oligoribonuclease/PAP phosphatase NrnA [bacterium]